MWQAPLMKLVGLIILLPLSITYLHLYYNTYWKNEYCFVGPHYTTKRIISSETENVANNEIRGTAEDQISSIDGSSSSNVEQFFHVYGIYAPTNASQKKKKKDKNNSSVDKRQFQQKYASVTTSSSSSSWFGGRSWMNRIIGGGGSWPSITQSSMLISSPTSKHLHYVHVQQDSSARNNSNHVISFVDATKQWCLQSLTSSNDEKGDYEKWCSDPIVNTHDDGTTILYVYPPSGIWKSTSTQQTQRQSSSLTISCPTLQPACRCW